MSFATTKSADGTRLRTWSNDASGTPVIISNGLGMPPSAWPALDRPDCGFRVVTWYQRGLDGSERPADRSRVRVEHHAEDLRAVLDWAGMDQALVIGWSTGVNVAFEFARQDPDRVAGILSVAGVPGGSFEALLGLFGLPRKVRPPLGRLGAQLVRIVGPVGSVLVGSLPPLPALVSPPALRGPVLEAMHPGVLYQVLREVARNDWNWFHDLLLGIAEHPVMDTSFVRFPVTVLLGRFDAVVSPQDARAAAERIPGVRVREFLSGTHYLPLQYPQVILEELRQLHQLAFKAPPPS